MSENEILKALARVRQRPNAENAKNNHTFGDIHPLASFHR
jgi:hypothetical protein